MFSVVAKQSRRFLLLISPHQRAGWRYTRSWEGTEPKQLIPTHQRDILYHTTPCAAYKAGRRRKGQTFGVMVFVFPSNRYTWWSLLWWRWLNTCLPMGSSELIPCSALLVGAAFASPIKLSLSQPTSFHTFTLLILFPIPPGRSERAAAQGWAAGWG